MNSLRLAGLFVVAGCLVPSVARGQDASNAAAADALFRQGRQLHEEKRYAEACPKFAESFRLDPATGSLLALASCHEAEGKLASAWAEYNETLARARREGQTERAETARQRAAAIEPMLGKLTIMLAPSAEIAGLEVKRDGVLVGPGAFGAPIPVDRGDHTVEATAPNHRPFLLRVSVADGATQVLTVPRLSSDVAPVAPVAPPQAATQTAAPPPAAAQADTSPNKSSSALRPIGIAALVVGAVAAGAGTYFGIQAISKNSDSNANNHCLQDVCDPEGKRLRLDARENGDTSTTLFVVSALFIGGGIVMYVVGGPKDPKAATLRPAVGTSAAGLTLRGAF